MWKVGEAARAVELRDVPGGDCGMRILSIQVLFMANFF